MPRSRLLKIVSALCALALAASPLVADPPTTKPSSPPATRPAEEQVAQAPSTEVPVRADDGQEKQTTEQKKFPTPAELIRQMKERKAAEQARTLVAQIDFSMPMSEQPAPVELAPVMLEAASPGVFLSLIMSRSRAGYAKNPAVSDTPDRRGRRGGRPRERYASRGRRPS